jgi:hypothetical protein
MRLAGWIGDLAPGEKGRFINDAEKFGIQPEHVYQPETGPFNLACCRTFSTSVTNRLSRRAARLEKRTRKKYEHLFHDPTI